MTTDPDAPARLRVGVVPAAAAASRPRLLAALEAAYPVRFEPRAASRLDGLDAVVAIDANVRAPAALPVLRAGGPEPAAGPERALALATADALERPLRGARLHDRHVAGALAGRFDAVLARDGDGAAVWAARGARRLVAHAPQELGLEEALRERLGPGRSLAVLALAHFLADVTAAARWRPPPPRAAFVLDDPNLHWPTYGHVRYAEIVAHARAHRHHVAIAMVPLDAWLVHPRAARAFREAPDALSVCVHGNDHTGPELWRLQDEPAAAAAAAQALRRMHAFEHRAGVPVSRVMVAPHERLSAASMRALAALGYEAVCNTRPYPSARELPTSGPAWLARPPEAGPLAGWSAPGAGDRGLPVLLRADFGHPREDLALRAFLGQPLILYGHQEDLRDGLDLLAQAAADVNALGDVTWGPLHAIARGAVETRRAGDVLHVRPAARRAALAVPDGVRAVVVDAGAPGAPAGGHVEAHSPAGPRAGGLGEPLEVAPGRLELIVPGPTPPLAAAAPRRRVWPLARRIASEGRDRVQAALSLG